MIVKKYISILFVFLQIFSGAQNTGLYKLNLDQKSNRLSGKLMGEVFYISAISNAHYFLQSEWTEGTITLKDGDVFSGIKMRYMAFGDELVAYNEINHSLFIVDKNTVSQFSFLKTSANSGSSIERKFINLDSHKIAFNKSYFEELYSGTSKLLCFHQIEQEKVNPYTDIDGRMYDTVFRLNNTYYILSVTFGINKIQLKNRSIYSVYPENKKEIRKILRKNKISIVDENSVIQAVKLLDSIGLFK